MTSTPHSTPLHLGLKRANNVVRHGSVKAIAFLGIGELIIHGQALTVLACINVGRQLEIAHR
jgi:hypothetical protein